MKLPLNIDTEVLLDVSIALNERTASNQSGYVNLVNVCRKHGLNYFQINDIIARVESDLTDMIVECIEENAENG
jgi:predicted transcriptional regulator with HTH domain